ncbi:hypothetical protein [Amycolatopsis minnesotensis]|uniref:Uncharacterized protein n=1 Tax=Amycolatopsis minnesotensis TaxID=337894 RepID=A0ABP5C1Y6_9PSEU
MSFTGSFVLGRADRPLTRFEPLRRWDPELGGSDEDGWQVLAIAARATPSRCGADTFGQLRAIRAMLVAETNAPVLVATIGTSTVAVLEASSPNGADWATMLYAATMARTLDTSAMHDADNPESGFASPGYLAPVIVKWASETGRPIADVHLVETTLKELSENGPTAEDNSALTGAVPFPETAPALIPTTAEAKLVRLLHSAGLAPAVLAGTEWAAAVDTVRH